MTGSGILAALSGACAILAALALVAAIALSSVALARRGSPVFGAALAFSALVWAGWSIALGWMSSALTEL